MIILKTSEERAIEFLNDEKVWKYKIYVSSCDEWLGSVDSKTKELIGCVGRKGKRVRCFYVKEEYRKQGIGGALLKQIMKDKRELTVYTTDYSYNLFIKNGFELVNKKNNINFVRFKNE